MKEVESKQFHNKSVFSTDNFALAVFLKTKAFKCLQISKDNPKHAFFHFEDSSEREKLIIEFWEGTALVEPRAFYNNQRELKTLLYDNSYSG
jgi:hypothetical protein